MCPSPNNFNQDAVYTPHMCHSRLKINIHDGILYCTIWIWHKPEIGSGSQLPSLTKLDWEGWWSTARSNKIGWGGVLTTVKSQTWDSEGGSNAYLITRDGEVWPTATSDNFQTLIWCRVVKWQLSIPITKLEIPVNNLLQRSDKFKNFNYCRNWCQNPEKNKKCSCVEVGVLPLLSVVGQIVNQQLKYLINIKDLSLFINF